MKETLLCCFPLLPTGPQRQEHLWPWNVGASDFFSQFCILTLSLPFSFFVYCCWTGVPNPRDNHCFSTFPKRLTETVWREKKLQTRQKVEGKKYFIGKHIVGHLSTILRCTSHTRWSRPSKRCPPSRTGCTARSWRRPRPRRGTASPSPCDHRRSFESTRSRSPSFPMWQLSSKLCRTRLRLNTRLLPPEVELQGVAPPEVAIVSSIQVLTWSK